ncbi:MAG: galactose-1-phosphate uridylyltransferase [Limnochordia bacterium]|jgi:UDPglucose--hexose-1-phosphate uridylyltransferase|nr:galactose-1-phosphate uridylyltransferase [Bacillota bacterium]HOB08303.1 galactose-1-phosphate uridylyltransferase [Limnochordia bacterium]NLH30943.1 galactose-1-phosphate uridylyltransferase [Bacillota bacterium]HPZ30545.1 galactose-1-phosphate uridylyltransferase [Limnochordia bacterium]HQD69977.1 galactose-1-phosphate uridylyltransferase [Limnochordia bacterium]
MSELRWNPQLMQWVIVATHRQHRTFKPPKEFCPLCPTKPGAFPTEIPAENYEIVVFENKFPSLRTPPPEMGVQPSDLYPAAPAEGICEVICYSPDHYLTLGDATAEHIYNLIQVWADRYRELGSKPGIEYVYIFENRGDAVGVTLHHPHGQIYAFPFIPPVPKQELEAAKQHKEKHGTCLYCDILKQEKADQVRIVCENSSFAAFVPFYARFPYEVHIFSKRHVGSLLDLTDDEAADLACILKELITGYDRLFGFTLPYIMALHQVPAKGDYPEYHLHFEFYPFNRTETKLKYLAGVESGAGTFITDMSPEEQAERLRGAVK